MNFDKIKSFFTYNYYAQKFLGILFIFALRENIWKLKNYFFKERFKLSFNEKSFKGWSIIFLTTTLDKNIFKNIVSYKKIFKNTKYEIIIICDRSKIKTFNQKKFKVVNLNSSDFTLGFKRNLGIANCKYRNIFMSLDYTIPIKINLKNLNKEIEKYDLICPRLLTIDKHRYLDWMYIDLPMIGKSFAPYNLKNTSYMYFHGTTYIFKKKFINKNLFSNFLDNKEGEDVNWSLKIRKSCLAKASSNIILRVKRKAIDNTVLNNKFFRENNNKLKYI